MERKKLTLKDEIRDIRIKRGASVEDFQRARGMTQEDMRDSGYSDEIIDKSIASITPSTLRFFSDALCDSSENMSTKLLSILREKSLGIKPLVEDADNQILFELSAYLIFIVDVFASTTQVPSSRKEIFYVSSTEALKRIRSRNPEYQEEEFNISLSDRLEEYGEIIRQPNSVIGAPRGVKIQNLLLKNLAHAAIRDYETYSPSQKEVEEILTGKRKIFKRRNRKKDPLTPMIYAYEIACLKTDNHIRRWVKAILEANSDIAVLGTKDLSRIISELKKARDK